ILHLAIVLNAALRFVNCFSVSKSHFPAVYRALCFVDVRLGRSQISGAAVVVDFDQMYNVAIKPAIEHCGLNTMGGDERGPLGLFKARCARTRLARLSLSTSRLYTIAVAFGCI